MSYNEILDKMVKEIREQERRAVEEEYAQKMVELAYLLREAVKLVRVPGPSTEPAQGKGVHKTRLVQKRIRVSDPSVFFQLYSLDEQKQLLDTIRSFGIKPTMFGDTERSRWVTISEGMAKRLYRISASQQKHDVYGKYGTRRGGKYVYVHVGHLDNVSLFIRVSPLGDIALASMPSSSVTRLFAVLNLEAEASKVQAQRLRAIMDESDTPPVQKQAVKKTSRKGLGWATLCKLRDAFTQDEIKQMKKVLEQYAPVETAVLWERLSGGRRTIRFDPQHLTQAAQLYKAACDIKPDFQRVFVWSREGEPTRAVIYIYLMPLTEDKAVFLTMNRVGEWKIVSAGSRLFYDVSPTDYVMAVIPKQLHKAAQAVLG